MKKLLLTLALAAVATYTYAQGTIQFANNAGTRFMINGIRAGLAGAEVSPGQFTFAVYAGATADSLSAQPLGGLGTNTPTAGLISSAPSPQAHAIPGFGANTTAFVQIRAWESRFPSWEAGQAGLHGQTATRSILLGPASGPGTVVWGAGANQFQAINLVPEPSMIALAVLGLGSLLLFRRRK
jgi:hypothetical protein